MEYSDEELLGILEEIDQLSGNVTTWEADFIESILENPPVKLTPKQREVVYKMKDKYL